MPYGSYQPELSFHLGEHHIHTTLSVPSHGNPTSPFLTPQAAHAITHFPLLAIGILDTSGNPWTSLWPGGQSSLLGENLVGIRAVVDHENDPVYAALLEQKFGERGGLMISLLPIDLVARRRVKMFGRVIAGAVGDAGSGQGGGEVQLVIKVEQSLGNCPKYLNQKSVAPRTPSPRIVSSGAVLSVEALDLVKGADLFFMSTANGEVDMDTNYRGGPCGFVRVTEDGAKLIYPEYSGNRLYQSLGNMITTPKVGICIPNFTTGSVLYLSGRSEILFGESANAKLPHTKLAVEIALHSHTLIEGGLPVRGTIGESSPYNPRVRLLATETAILPSDKLASEGITARLIQKEILSSTITRYRFITSLPLKYKPGQWIALDFSKELDAGYSHMRDSDPGSLNDDYVRTFTISSPPPVAASHPNANEFEIILRTYGPVTKWLRQQHGRAGIEIGVLGIGGDFEISAVPSQAGAMQAFVAGGVGITPLLAQIPSLDLARLRIVWVIKLEDADFVLDVFLAHLALAKSVEVFFTGGEHGDFSNVLARVQQSGAQVEQGRLTKTKLLVSGEVIDRWYVCAGDAVRKQVLDWLPGQNVVFESFGY